MGKSRGGRSQGVNAPDLNSSHALGQRAALIAEQSTGPLGQKPSLRGRAEHA